MKSPIELNVSIYKLKGSRQEIGLGLGKIYKKLFGENYIANQLKRMKGSFLYEGLGMNFDLDSEFVKENYKTLSPIVKSLNPELFEEIEGFAIGLGEELEKTFVFIVNYGSGTGCTHFYANGYHARNYDDNPKNVDNIGIIIDSGNTISFGLVGGGIGRIDGINSCGLTTSLSFGAGYISEKKGIGAIFFQRMLLDLAKSVDDAKALLREIQYISPNNLLISDSFGNAIAVEQSRGKIAIRNSNEGVIYCANSYLSSEMLAEQRFHNPTTRQREDLLQTKLKDNFSFEDAQNILLENYPRGLYEKYFEEDLGTLWTVIYQPKNLDIFLNIGALDLTHQFLNFNLKTTDSFSKEPLVLTGTSSNENIVFA